MVDYCTIAQVRSELDEITTTDISDARITSCIERAEAFIDLKTKTSFKENTETDEFYDTNDETMWVSPERRLGLGTSTDGLSRSDSALSGNLDSIKLKHNPIITMTSLSRNTAGVTSTDAFDSLTEQTGTGGDFILNYRTGVITFINNKPYFGRKRSFKVTYSWGLDRTAEDNESARKTSLTNELAILLTVRQILTMKGSASQFSSIDSISLESISISKNVSQTVGYLQFQKERIDELFAELGITNVSLGMI